MIGDPDCLRPDADRFFNGASTGANLDPEGFAFLLKVHGFLRLEDFGPVFERLFGERVADLIFGEVPKFSVHHREHRRGATPCLGEFVRQGRSWVFFVLPMERVFYLRK